MSDSPDNDFMNRMETDTRTLVMALLQAGERYARELERQHELARRGAQNETERATQWIEAEKQTQGAVNSLTRKDRWWETATPQQAATAYARAAAWREEDPTAAATAARVRDEMRNRWGVDPEDILRQARQHDARARGEEGQALQLVNEADLTHEREDAARDQQANDRRRDLDGDGHPEAHSAITDEDIAALKWDTAEARATMAGAWDSPERRQKLAEQMRRDGLSEEAIQSRITADRGVGEPPQAAVNRPVQNQQSGTRAHKRGRGQQLDRNR